MMNKPKMAATYQMVAPNVSKAARAAFGMMGTGKHVISLSRPNYANSTQI